MELRETKFQQTENISRKTESTHINKSYSSRKYAINFAMMKESIKTLEFKIVITGKKNSTESQEQSWAV